MRWVLRYCDSVLMHSRCVDCSNDRKKRVDIGVKLSRAYLDDCQYEAAMSLCETLMESMCGDEDPHCLSLSRCVASAAAASPDVCTHQRRMLVGALFLLYTIHTSSIPHVSSSLATSHMLICSWTTAERSGLVWPPYQGIGTADQADLVKLGYTQLNMMSLHLTLVWQLSVIEHKIDRRGGRLSKWQRTLDKPHDDDDDDDVVHNSCCHQNQS